MVVAGKPVTPQCNIFSSSRFRTRDGPTRQQLLVTAFSQKQPATEQQQNRKNRQTANRQTATELLTQGQQAQTGGRKRDRSNDRDDSAYSGDNGDSGGNGGSGGSGGAYGGGGSEPAPKRRKKIKHKSKDARRMLAAKGR